MRMFLTFLLAAAAADSAHADTGLYAGVGVVEAKVHDISLYFNGLGPPSHIDATSWKAIVGWRPIKPFALEANYIDLGSSHYFWNDGNLSFSGKAVTAYAVGFVPLPLPNLEVYGKAGLDRWTLNGNVYYVGRRSDQSTQFAWGGGAQVHFGRIGARLEYERLSLLADRAYVYTFGITYLLL